MPWKKLEFWLATFLVVYLLVLGVGAALTVVINFPIETENGVPFPQADEDSRSFLRFGRQTSPEQGLILLAFLAGITGSFLHTGQSLISYIGNSSFRASWTAWFVLRPWIGGVLGLAIYFVFRAGLLAGATGVDSANPYGVVALGLLGGWFSKTTADKLQEVFETMFKTDGDKKRKDKLQAIERPGIDAINPSPVPTNTDEIIILGRNFLKGATVIVDGQELQAEFVSETELKATIVRRPATGTQVSIQIKNPSEPEPVSRDVTVLFE